MSNWKRAIGFGLALSLQIDPAMSPASDSVVSQVYGGGGNSGALLKADFVELLNRGDGAIDLNGWSLQYASASASTWQVTELAGVLQPGSYYLLQLGGGAGGSVDLPPPDAIGTINMSAGSGKVALVAETASLQGACPTGPSIEDIVGYGSANCFEGTAAAPAGSNTTGLIRGQQGCADSDNNSTDFEAADPMPRNQSVPTTDCGLSGSPTESATVPPPTPTVAPSVEVSASPTCSATTSPSGSPTRTASPSASPSGVVTAIASAVPSASVGATSSPTPTMTESATAATTTTGIGAASPTCTATAAQAATSTPIAIPSPTHVECGNGVLEAGEQCDDGNDADGDLCPTGCSYVASGTMLHGNHRRRLARGDGCQLEWYVVDSDLTIDSFGFAAQTQTCVDQDPGCDFAPEVDRCRFMVVVCLNNKDAKLPDCDADGISRTEIIHPRDNRASSGVRMANRSALEYALAHLIDPANPLAGPVNGPPLTAADRGFCSVAFPLEIERRLGARSAASLTVDTFGVAGERPHRERARLRLECLP